MRGAQISIMIAFVVGIVSTVIGVIIGALSGYFRGWVEGVLMRFTDVMHHHSAAGDRRRARPASSAGPGRSCWPLVLGLVVWTSLARLVRGEFLSLREKEFVEAARALGARPTRIIFRHILPNTVGRDHRDRHADRRRPRSCWRPRCRYLGFGVGARTPRSACWSATYQNAFATRPWLFWWPGLFIIAIALSVNFIGDGCGRASTPGRTGACLMTAADARREAAHSATRPLLEVRT